MTPHQALQEAIAKAGSQTALASALSTATGEKVETGHIYYWLNTATEVPAKWAPPIERHTGVRCELLCPSVDWAVLRQQAASPDDAAQPAEA